MVSSSSGRVGGTYVTLGPAEGQILFVLQERKQFLYSTVNFIYIQQFSDLLSSSPAALLSLSSPESDTNVNCISEML